MKKKMALPVTRTPISGYLKVSNQTNSTPVYIRLINQSNRSISVRLFASVCSHIFISRSYENRSIYWEPQYETTTATATATGTSKTQLVQTPFTRVSTNISMDKFFPVQAVYTEPCKFRYRLQHCLPFKNSCKVSHVPCKRKANQCNFFFPFKTFSRPVLTGSQ